MLGDTEKTYIWHLLKQFRLFPLIEKIFCLRGAEEILLCLASRNRHFPQYLERFRFVCFLFEKDAMKTPKSDDKFHPQCCSFPSIGLYTWCAPYQSDLPLNHYDIVK